MRKLLKCKLPAFWCCYGAQHRTGPQSLHWAAAALELFAAYDWIARWGWCKGRAELSQIARRAPIVPGPPKRCTHSGEWEVACKDQAALHTLEPRPAWDFRRELFGVRCILGEQLEGETFDKLVKLDRRTQHTTVKFSQKKVQRKDVKKILTIQAAPGCLDQASRKVKPGLASEVLTESGGGYQYKTSSSFHSCLSPPKFSCLLNRFIILHLAYAYYFTLQTHSFKSEGCVCVWKSIIKQVK